MFVIKVGDKDYPLPNLDFDHWKKVIEQVERRNAREVNNNGMISVQGIDDARDFFFDLLNPYHSEITKKVLGKMPPYQGGTEFFGLMLIELMRVPLDFAGPKGDAESPSEIS